MTPKAGDPRALELASKATSCFDNDAKALRVMKRRLRAPSSPSNAGFQRIDTRGNS